MSHHRLQRALVVALHDPAFVAAMHADPESTLAPFALAPAERHQLLAVDRRAFAVDRLRARRLLRVLVEELKASTALALAETRSLAFADGFFAAPEFRHAIASDGHLVLAFADYLTAACRRGRLTTPQLEGVLAVEATRARARRAAHRPSAAGIALAPGVSVLATTASALESIQLLEQHLFEVGLMPHVALVDDPPPPPVLPAPGGEPLYLLFRPYGDDIALEAIDAPLYHALAALAVAGAAERDRAEAARIVAGLGLPLLGPELLIGELLADGLLFEMPIDSQVERGA